MIVSRMVKCSRVLLAVPIVLVVSSLVLGMSAPPSSDSGVLDAPATEANYEPSVTCIPLGLYGDITTPPIVGRLSDSSDNLTFVGTTNGLYVVAQGGKLQHFLYSPFGIKHIALINDITGDGTREVVVALKDTQVPALRCYDGATWEKLWQFAPVARIWDRLWVERQLLISNFEVRGLGDSQSLLITSGRRVLSIDAKKGTEQWRFGASSALWRMVTLADINNDGADEVFVGSDDGHLFWLNGKTGRLQWKTKLPRHKEADYRGMAHLVSDIAVMDEESGKVAVASGDGWVQMYDLRAKRREWDTLVFVREDPHNPVTSNYLLMSPTADITGDGLAELLLSKVLYDIQYSDQYRGYMTNGAMALCDSAGNVVWQRGTSTEGASVWPGMAFETGVFEGKPVYLDRSESEPWVIRLVDVQDGKSVLHTIPLDALNGTGVIIKQPSGNGYLSFSSDGDLAAISAKGELLWHYPRITGVKAENGNFVGSGSEDVLFWGEAGMQQSSGSVPIYDADGRSMYVTDPVYEQPGQGREARLLHMMDGATRAMAWSYEVPYGEFKSLGGLKGIQVTPDLVGSDGIRDIVGYREDTVFIFSGKDGAHSSFPVGQPIESLEVIRYGSSGNSIAVSIAGGLMIFDATGTLLRTTATTEWIGDESGRFMALDDVNSDNASDLAIISSTKIMLLKSVAVTDNYESHLTFQAEAGYSFSEVQMVPDADNDGVRDLACIQRAQEKQQGEQHVQPPNPLLSKISLVDGKELFRVQLPVSWWTSYDLACGDFNGDGCADSLFIYYGQGSDDLESPGVVVSLGMLSGRDGTTLRTHAIDVNGYGRMPAVDTPLAINIGDVDGDGTDDLACTSSPCGSYEPLPGGGYSYTAPEDMQLSVHVYSAARDSILKSVPATFHFNYYGDWNPSQVAIDVDEDGYLEVISDVTETDMSSYGDEYSSYSQSSKQYIAVVDVDGGRRLAGFTGFDTTNASLFETHQPGILGVAACGGACFLSIGSHLQVTSPEDGARMGPTVGVKWDGSTGGDFSQVFVDGVRNSITNGFGSELFLARGSHTILIRSVDDSGRISYSPSDLSAPLSIKVSPSPWKPALLVASLLILVAIVLLLFYAKLQRTWRARRRVAK